MEEGSFAVELERTMAVISNEDGESSRALTICGPTLPVAPIRAMFLNGVDMVACLGMVWLLNFVESELDLE